MIYSSGFLELVSELGKRNLFKDPVKHFQQGSCLIRGYADLGTELFLVVAEGKIVSLFTGTASGLPKEHAGFFTRVPGIEDLSEAILLAGYDLVDIQYIDQRHWRIVAENITDKDNHIEVINKEFEVALAGVLLKIVMSKENS